LIYTEIFTVNIRSRKIHELVLAVTGIIVQYSGVFELVFFYVEWKEILKINKKSSIVFEK